MVENQQREDLSPLEEAEAYSRLIDEFGRTQASLAEALGKSRAMWRARCVCCRCRAPVRHRLEEGELPAGHARALLATADPAALGAEVACRGLNVRATERLVPRRVGVPRKPQTRDVDTTALEPELSAALGLRLTIESKQRGAAP